MGNVFTVQCSPDNALSRCLDCIVRHTNYAWELGKNVGILRTDWEELKGRRNDINVRIEVEERDPHMKVCQEVTVWLSKVDAMEAAGVEDLIRDGYGESVNKCIGGCCPKSCTTNYKLGKKIAKKQREVTSLQSKGIFDVVTQRSSLPRADERPAEQTLGLKSTFDEVCSSLQDEQVGTIGLYGMGGVGKTTLLTQVYNKSRNISEGKNCSLSFNVVIWIVVSQTPNLTKVQDDIGNQTGLRIDSKEWKEKSPEDKAMEIFTVLKEKKFVLFLDDIWERLDFNKLGVPIPDQNNKSKVVFTTRSKNVCGRMEARKLIQVKCLAWKEAWDLFQQKVGKETLEAHSEIPVLAKEVAKECDGLPLALITIGRAMAYKTTPEAWHHAIDLLRNTTEFPNVEDEVFPLLKFSYDSLPNAIVRSCFLYCSLFPEDWKISKDELIEKWICEGFLVKFKDDLCKARNEGHYCISTLVHASLLEECSPEKVKMHDVIRDMALWIACDCGAMKNKFFVQAGAGLSETPNVTYWEGAERVSLMNNKIRDFTETPDCPNLLTLFLNNNDEGNCQFSSGFFRSMRNLRVLDLERCNLDRLPEEICELVSLQYLNISNNSELKELPINLQNLINLKCLYLSRISSIGVIPEGLLSSFKKLQILKLIRYISSLTSELPKTFVDELESLKYLNDLEITLTTHFEFSGFSSSHKLTSITTSLDIDGLDRMRYLDLSFLKRMTNLKTLEIYRCRELEEMIYVEEGKTRNSEIRNDDVNCFHSLRSVKMDRCDKIKNLTWLTFAPNVEEIQILGCLEMKALVVGKHREWDEVADEEEEGGRPIPFAKLTSLWLWMLPQLESIYPSALPFPCLKELTVYECPKLKKLPLNSSSGCKSGITIHGRKEWWNEVLEWEDETTRLAFQSSFKPF